MKYYIPRREIIFWPYENKCRYGKCPHVPKQEQSIWSVLEDFGILVFCCQFQFLLLLHVAVASHGAQVASIHRQQHHGGRKGSVANVSQALSSYHGEDPGREQGTER